MSRAPQPHGLLPRIARTPLWFYHRDLGFLLGKRFLYLAHQGRLSGLRRETVLEVVQLDHETGEVIVFSGCGNRADWVKNLRAGRALEIRIGHLRLLEPEHRFLSHEERRAVLIEYKEVRPLTWWALARLTGLPEDPKNDDIGDMRAVAFRPNRWDAPS
ncbi:nitroreductase family deazaflavin-dependent oxidoreductase [Actinoallomurus acanthiterrae]